MLLKDKVVLITGIGPGMGQHLARIAAEEGAKIAICARNKERLDDYAADIAKAGGDVIAIPTDIADEGQVNHFVDTAAQHFGRIDGLVNSAYKHVGFKPFEDADLDVWRASMETNFFGTLSVIQKAVPHMKAAGGGAIVSVNTMANRKPMAGEGGYASAKAAMAGATRMLAQELGQYNIRVNSTFMGWLWGPGVQGYVAHTAKAQGVEQAQIIKGITRNIPLGVVPPDEECAKTVLMFVSDYTKMVTGASLDVNGGEFMTP